jgi:hypothetical protein
MYHAAIQEVVIVNTTTAEPAQKKPYAAPKLVVYGTVSKLTQGLAGSGTDGGPAGMSMMA